MTDHRPDPTSEAAKLAALRAAIQVGLDDVEAGRVITLAPGTEAEFVAGLGHPEAPPPPLRGPPPPS